MKLKNLDLLKISCLTAASLMGIGCTQSKVEDQKTTQIESQPKNLNLASDKKDPISYDKNDPDYCPPCGMG